MGDFSNCIYLFLSTENKLSISIRQFLRGAEGDSGSHSKENIHSAGIETGPQKKHTLSLTPSLTQKKTLKQYGADGNKHKAPSDVKNVVLTDLGDETEEEENHCVCLLDFEVTRGNFKSFTTPQRAGLYEGNTY